MSSKSAIKSKGRGGTQVGRAEVNVILCGRNKGWERKSLEKYLGKM